MSPTKCTSLFKEHYKASLNKEVHLVGDILILSNHVQWEDISLTHKLQHELINISYERLHELLN
jgi:hypothetical protein